jgi:hypothetical protein
MKDTIDMAREVKMPYDFVTGEPINLEKLKAFEALVRADEREACATVCEKMRSETPIGKTSRIEALFFAARAIRARGQA